jgi:N-acetylglutamate synthase-like GNAT family acetyltransferase
MKLRKFKKSDAKRCSEIIYACVDISKKTTIKDKEFLKRIYAPIKIEKLPEKSDYFVIEKNKKIVGQGRLHKYKIATVYFDPKFHKKGGGKMILKKLESLAKTREIKRVWLESLLQSTGFYEKCGFKKVKRMYKPINAMRMEKKL